MKAFIQNQLEKYSRKFHRGESNAQLCNTDKRCNAWLWNGWVGGLYPHHSTPWWVHDKLPNIQMLPFNRDLMPIRFSWGKGKHRWVCRINLPRKF